MATAPVLRPSSLSEAVGHQNCHVQIRKPVVQPSQPYLQGQHILPHGIDMKLVLLPLRKIVVYLPENLVR